MHVSWYRRLFIVSLTTLLCFTLFTPAFATTPEFLTFPVDETFEVGECDGFTVMEDVEGSIKVSIHSDQDGNYAMRISRIRLRHTLRNSETGASLFTPDVGIDLASFNKEGDHTVAVLGLVTRLVVPGEGLFFADVGRIVYDSATEEAIFEAGQHDNYDDLLPALCSALD